jgi:CBS domain-containing protein
MEGAMRMQDLMTKPVFTVSAAAAAEDAWNLMRAQRVRHLVVSDRNRVVGVLSDRDAGGARGSAVRRNRTVAELMTRQVVTVPPDATIRKAANLMRGRSIGCLVVTRRDRIAGIVTVTDLLELIGRGLERPVGSAPRRTLSHRAPHRKRHQSAGAW